MTPRRLHYLELGELVEEVMANFGPEVIRPEEGGRNLLIDADLEVDTDAVSETDAEGGAWRLRLPLVLPDLDPTLGPEDILRRLREPLGLQLVVLIQAGATALGLWEDDDILAHKVIKKYVVRGKGRAQPLHRKTRGKSRYGSRLRLQNARRQLDETAAKVASWRGDHGGFDRVFMSCPVAMRGAYREALEPSLEGAGAAVRVPMDVRIPNLAELARVRRFLERGELSWRGDEAD